MEEKPELNRALTHCDFLIEKWTASFRKELYTTLAITLFAQLQMTLSLTVH